MGQADEVRGRLARAAYAGLDRDLADVWLAMLEPGVRLRAGPVRGQVSLGRRLPVVRRHRRDEEPGLRPDPCGWLGGLPLLPRQARWPHWEGHGPLAHIATLDCAQLQPVLPARLRDAGFPEDGWLSFFYFESSADGGTEVVGSLFAGTGDGARVCYSAPGHVELTSPPQEVQPYPKVGVTARPVLTWATWEHPRLHEDGRPAPGWDQIWAELDQLRLEQDGSPAHQVGGNPDPVQGPVELEVAYGQLSSGGQDKIAWTDPAVRSAADDWILLAQIDTDSQAGFLWGDCGVLYYLIRPADLAARRFDRTAFTWQCS